LVHAYNDSIAALVSGTDGARLEGVVLIAGTGMICKGFTTGGKEQWTTGGNGALIDKGSGFSIGIAVAHAAFKAFDGMGPPTPLLKATLDFLKIEHAPEIVDWYAHACTSAENQTMTQYGYARVSCWHESRLCYSSSCPLNRLVYLCPQAVC
jgi:N-acetylglucosamine kinase-like BadF-type ATPase